MTMTLVTAAIDLGSDDSLSWNTVGSVGDTLSNTFAIFSDSYANEVIVSEPGADETYLGQECAFPGCTYNGNFSPGEYLLLTSNSGVPAPDGKLRMTMPTGVGFDSLGARIQSQEYGSYTVKLEFFDQDGVSLGTVTRSGTNNGDVSTGDGAATFVGALTDVVASIAEFSLIAAPSDESLLVLSAVFFKVSASVPPDPAARGCTGAGTLTQVLVRGDLPTNDTVVIADIGPSGSAVSSPYDGVTSGGRPYILSEPDAVYLARFLECPATGCSTNCNFDAGDEVLRTTYVGASPAGVMRFEFLEDFDAAGANSASEEFGDFTTKLEFFDSGNNSLGCVTRDGTNDGNVTPGTGTAIFIGATTTSAARAVEFSLISAPLGNLVEHYVNNVIFHFTPITPGGGGGGGGGGGLTPGEVIRFPPQKYIARLMGHDEDRPIYATVCNPPPPARHIGRIHGQDDNTRPVYSLAQCGYTAGYGAMPTGDKYARLMGQYDRPLRSTAEGRAIYAVVCCSPLIGPLGSSGSLSPSGSQGGSQGVSASASGSLGVSGSASGSLAASLGPSLPGSEVEAGSVSGSGSLRHITTACCPVTGLPEILHAVIFNQTGTCACLPAALTFTWNGVLGLSAIWNSEVIHGCSSDPMTFFIRCRAGAVDCIGMSLLSSQCVSMGSVNPAGDCSCDPAYFHYTVTGLTDCCAGGFEMIVTE